MVVQCWHDEQLQTGVTSRLLVFQHKLKQLVVRERGAAPSPVLLLFLGWPPCLYLDHHLEELGNCLTVVNFFFFFFFGEVTETLSAVTAAMSSKSRLSGSSVCFQISSDSGDIGSKLSGLWPVQFTQENDNILHDGLGHLYTYIYIFIFIFCI